MRVDAQIHLWNPETPATPWRRGWAPYAPAAAMSPETALRVMDGAGVECAALVPAEWDVRGSELVLAAATARPDRFIAFPTLSTRHPAAPSTLQEWRQRPAFGGLRQVFLPGEGSPLDDGSATWLLQAADDYALPLMLWVPRQQDRLHEIATTYSRIRLVVDHFNVALPAGSVDLDASLASLVALAARPNVAVKASSMYRIAADLGDRRHLDGALRAVVDAYGAHRVFWGSDITQQGEGVTYAAAESIIRSTPDLSADQLEWIMGLAFTEWVGWQPQR